MTLQTPRASASLHPCALRPFFTFPTPLALPLPHARTPARSHSRALARSRARTNARRVCEYVCMAVRVWGGVCLSVSDCVRLCVYVYLSVCVVYNAVYLG
jgi:hypothetical protein